jgi:excisionase family DNA binding protein
MDDLLNLKHRGVFVPEFRILCEDWEGKLTMSDRKRATVIQPLLLSITDVAVQLGVCRQTVYAYIYHEGLPSIKVRGMRRIHPDSLRRWLAERERCLA